MVKAARSAAPVFVLGAGGCNALGVLRAFGRRGIPVYVFGHRPTAACTLSRYGKVFDSPSFDDVDAVTEFVLAQARKHDESPVCLISSDEALRYWLASSGRLEGHLRMALGPAGAVRQFADKAEFAKLVAASGADGPKTEIVTSLDAARAAAAVIGYPCLLKPAMPHEFGLRYGLKCFRLGGDRDAIKRWHQVEDLAQTMLVQEEVPGNRFYMWYGYRSHALRLEGWCGYHKRRRWPPDYGNATLLRAEPCPQLVGQGELLLNRAGYFGPAEAEFKYDERDGRWKIIEINARTIMQNRFSAALGCDVEYMAYCDATGQSVCRDRPPNGREVLWTETHKDMAAAFFEQGMTLPAWVRSRRGRKVYAFFAWDDPIPAFTRLPEALTAVAGTVCRRWFPGVYAKLRGQGSIQNDSGPSSYP